MEAVGGTVKDTAANGATSVGSAAKSVGNAVKRAKTPLLAGGAALAGLAGALAARSMTDDRGGAMNSVRKALPGSSRSHGFSLPKLPKRKGSMKGGVRNISKNVSEAAKQADRIGQRVSSVATAVQKVSETADNAAKKA